MVSLNHVGEAPNDEYVHCSADRIDDFHDEAKFGTWVFGLLRYVLSTTTTLLLNIYNDTQDYVHFAVTFCNGP